MNTISVTSDVTPAGLRKAAEMLVSLAVLTEADSASENVKIEDHTHADNTVTTENTTVTAPEGVELDKSGLPWDVRIHAASKAKLSKTELWRKKRGVIDTFVTTVEAELRAAMAAPAADNVIEIAPGPSAPGPGGPSASALEPAAPLAEVKFITPDGEWTREQLVMAGWKEEAVAVLPIAEAEVVTTTTGTTFTELMGLISPALVAGTITDADVTAALDGVGIAALPLLSARPDFINAVKTTLFG